jgi:hypothetical protein
MHRKIDENELSEKLLTKSENIKAKNTYKTKSTKETKQRLQKESSLKTKKETRMN